MVKRIYLFLIFLFTFSLPAFSGEAVDCYNRQNTLEIAGCFNEQLAKYDATLNTTYNSAIKILKKRGTGESLLNAQREWIIYRDKNCQFHSDLYFGGSAAGPAMLECKARMTKERSDELSIVLEDLERHYQ